MRLMPSALPSLLPGAFGFPVEKHPVPAAGGQAAGLQSITNLIVRRRFGGQRQDHCAECTW